MSEFHEVLGLEEGESDLRTIRSAYARKVREHRPDEDPEGFRAVHEAYTTLVQWSRYEQVEVEDEPEDELEDEPPAPAGPRLAERATRPGAGDPAPELDDAPAPERDDPPLAERDARPRPVADPFPELRGAEGADLVPALLAAGRKLRAEPRLAASWSTAVDDTVQDPGHLLQGVKPADLVTELDHGLVAVTARMVDHCIETGHLSALEMLASAIARSDVEPHDFDQATRCKVASVRLV